jgi:DNA-binding LacI/PurR family transcriptional regulator
VNIYDVAKQAGVGIGTVSRVLNGNGKVKPETRTRVLDVIRQLDYVPHSGARSLGSGRTNVLGLIVPFFTKPFFVEVLRGVEMAATARGYELVLYNVETHEQRNRYLRQLPMRRRVDGLLIVSLACDEAEAQHFLKMNVPTVLVDAYNPLLTSLVVDNVKGAQMAVEYLIGLGHRRIGFVNGSHIDSFSFTQTNDRLAGYRQALANYDIAYDATLVYVSQWTREAGREAARQLLCQSPRPSAIFAASDSQAFGVLEGARAQGLRVPDDLAIVGFDNIELAGLLGLTTIAQPMCEMGRLAVERLLTEIEQPGPPQTVLMDVELVRRGTSAATIPIEKE